MIPLDCLLYVRQYRVRGFDHFLKDAPLLISQHMICKHGNIEEKNRNLAQGIAEHTLWSMICRMAWLARTSFMWWTIMWPNSTQPEASDSSGRERHTVVTKAGIHWPQVRIQSVGIYNHCEYVPPFPLRCQQCPTEQWSFPRLGTISPHDASARSISSEERKDQEWRTRPKYRWPNLRTYVNSLYLVFI